MRWEEVALRLALALLIGGTIGAEREGDRPAGFRTYHGLWGRLWFS